MGHLLQIRRLRAGVRFTEKTGLVGGLTSLRTLCNRKSLTLDWFCFAQLLQDDLDNVKEHWNTHLIRGSRHDTISGRPDELFFLLEVHGGEDDLLHPVLDDEIQSIRENLTYEEEKSI